MRTIQMTSLVGVLLCKHVAVLRNRRLGVAPHSRRHRYQLANQNVLTESCVYGPSEAMMTKALFVISSRGMPSYIHTFHSENSLF